MAKSKAVAAAVAVEEVAEVGVEVKLPNPNAGDRQIGDKVIIIKDHVPATVVDAFIRPGRKQTQITVKRDDNGGVYTLWFDEVA